MANYLVTFRLYWHIIHDRRHHNIIRINTDTYRHTFIIHLWRISLCQNDLIYQQYSGFDPHRTPVNITVYSLQRYDEENIIRGICHIKNFAVITLKSFGVFFLNTRHLNDTVSREGEIISNEELRWSWTVTETSRYVGQLQIRWINSRGQPTMGEQRALILGEANNSSSYKTIILRSISQRKRSFERPCYR